MIRRSALRRRRIEQPATDGPPRLHVHVLGPRAEAGQLADFIAEQLERYEGAELLRRGKLDWNGKRYGRVSFELEPVE